MAGIVIIHNTFARGNIRRPGILLKIKKIVGDYGEVVSTKTIDELPLVAELCLKREIDILGVNGGDGSMHTLLTAFINIYKDHPLPKIIALRGGTMNTMPNSLKLKGKTLEILQKLIEKYTTRTPLDTIGQHLIKLNDKYGFMSGAGIPPNFLSAYYDGTTTGPWQGIKVIARTIGSVLIQGPFAKFIMAPAKCKLKVEEKELPDKEFVAILACTIREIGLGFTPTPRAYDKPGCFHFIATTIAPIKIIPKIPALWLGWDLNLPEVFSQPVSKAKIEPLANLRYMIDGEIYETEEPIEITCGPTIELIKI